MSPLFLTVTVHSDVCVCFTIVVMQHQLNDNNQFSSQAHTVCNQMLFHMYKLVLSTSEEPVSSDVKRTQIFEAEAKDNFRNP